MLVQIAPLLDPRKPVRFFARIINRPAVTFAAMLATVALGARALVGLESSVEPGVGRPAIGITVRYPGALPVDVEREIVRPIERRVAGLDGIVRSEATARDGLGRIVLYFDYLRDLDDTFQPVHDSVAAVRSELPRGADAPVVARIDPVREPAIVPIAVDPWQPGGALAGLAVAILEGAVLALLIIFCFVRSWRSALIVLVTVAIATVGVFEAMALAGLRLTLTTMLGLALAMMFLIDDAVIVRESIVRHGDLGLDLPSAASRGTVAVVRGLAIACLATHAVFGSIALSGGASGRWFGAMALIVMGAVGVSLAVSALVIPSLSMLWPASPAARRGPTRAWVSRIDWLLEGLADRYHEMLAWSLDHRRTVGLIAVAATAIVTAMQIGLAKPERLPSSIDLEVHGPDTHTLFGVALRIADDVRTVPGTRDVLVSTSARDDGNDLAQIDHVDGERVVHVLIETNSGPTSDVVNDIDARLAAIPLPPDYRLRRAGQMADRVDDVRRLSSHFAVALALLFVVLVVRFRSLVEPVAVLLAVPLALAGSVGALLVTRTPIGTLTLVAGAFTIIGVVRHAVLLLLAAKDRHTQDLNDRVSLIEAARRRLRPTVIGGAAVIAAMVPVALAGGGSPGIHRSVGIAVIGGVIASSIVTLLVVPVLFATLADARDRVAAWSLSLGARSASDTPLEPGD